VSTSNFKSYAKYEDDEFFNRWLTDLSPDTKKHYANEIVSWITFVGMTPTEQIRKRMHDLTLQNLAERTFFEEQFRKYTEYLNKVTMKPLAVQHI